MLENLKLDTAAAIYHSIQETDDLLNLLDVIYFSPNGETPSTQILSPATGKQMLKIGMKTTGKFFAHGSLLQNPARRAPTRCNRSNKPWVLWSSLHSTHQY